MSAEGRGIYARDTSVSVARSKAEIEELVTRYGATGFATASQADRALVLFEASGRRVRFMLLLPSRDGFARYEKKANQHAGSVAVYDRTPEQQAAAWEQACRQRWRALALVVKAKLEAVASGVAEFEDEFLSYIVLPDGSTLGEKVRPQLAASYASGSMPPLLALGDGSKGGRRG